MTLTTTNIPAPPKYVKSNLEQLKSAPDAPSVQYLNLLQALSPECTLGHEREIPGAKAGLFCLTGTKDICRTVDVVVLQVMDLFKEWVNRDKGGGLRATYLTAEEAERNCEAGNQIDKSTDFICTLVGVDDQMVDDQPLVISCNRSKLSTAKQWKAMLIATQNVVAAKWQLTSMVVQGKKGTYFNIASPVFLGYNSKAELSRYTEISSQLPQPESKLLKSGDDDF